MRRLRRTAPLRAMVRETELSAAHLVSPMFVVDGLSGRRPIPVASRHRSPRDRGRGRGSRRGFALGIPAVLLFGLPADKDDDGSGAWDDEGAVQLAVRAIKAAHPDGLVITDVCLCEYTRHGHCGLLRPDGAVDNDATLDLLARTAVSHARAGADAVAPSDMMDGRVGHLRAALDEAGFADTALVAYSAKYASAFYGPSARRPTPRRRSATAAGIRWIPPTLRRRARGPARRERGRRRRHGQAGAPVPGRHPARQGGHRPARRRLQRLGEYAMIKAAAAQDLLDERTAVLEALTGIRRAGADIVITYHAKDAARWLG
jgi:porphobilinogen synthase